VELIVEYESLGIVEAVRHEGPRSDWHAGIDAAGNMLNEILSFIGKPYEEFVFSR